MKIYSDVWKTLSKLTNYLQSIDELNESDNTINDFNSLKEKRSKSCNELKEEKDGLKNLIDSNEPFLPENIYNVLNEIVSEAQKIFEICFKYVEIKKNASTKDFEKLKMHRNEIENKKKTLVKEIRKYINSLKLEVNT